MRFVYREQRIPAEHGAQGDAVRHAVLRFDERRRRGDIGEVERRAVGMNVDRGNAACIEAVLGFEREIGFERRVSMPATSERLEVSTLDQRRSAELLTDARAREKRTVIEDMQRPSESFLREP